MVIVLTFNWSRHFEREFLVGVIVGVTAVGMLAQMRPRRWDAVLGNASYGCFLSHVVIFAMMKALFGVAEFTPGLRIFSIVVAVGVGLASYHLLERPTITWRRKIGVASQPVSAREVDAVASSPIG